MNFVLLNRFGIPTMRRIVAQMEQPVELIIRRPSTFDEHDICIRWSCTISQRLNGAKVINNTRSILLASDKARSRMKMQDMVISVPLSWWADECDADESFPCIVRPNKHRKGQYFYVVGNAAEMSRVPYDESWYCSEIIEKTNEYRVHVGHGKILFINEKPLIPGEIRGNQHITGQSWGQVIHWNDYNTVMCKLACDAVKCVGLDVGAVDIIKDEDENFYVCEVNTAPTLGVDDTYSVERYARYFDWIFRHNGGEWWNYNEWNQGKSFAWKNSQLSA